MLDLENLSVEEKTFLAALTGGGFPVDEASLRAELQAIAADAGLTISNPSGYSSFWSFCTAAVISPVGWLAAFLVRRVMPGLYVKTASGAMLDLLAWSYGVTRKPAVRATGMITFSRGPGVTGEITIAAGTVVRSDAIAGVVRRMTTTAAGTIAAESSSTQILAVADGAGSAWNLAAGLYRSLEGSSLRLAVSNDADYLVTPGADEESDDELRLRLRNHFSAVADWHTDAKYKAMIAELTGFRVDRLFFVHDAPRGAGTADCYALFDAGVDPVTYLATVNDYISTQGNHGHGDDLVVYAMPSTHYAVRLRLTLQPSATAADRLAIEAAVRAAFRQSGDYPSITRVWPYSAFSWSRLDYELHSLFPAIKSLLWESRPATAAEIADGEFDAGAIGWSAGDIVSELDVPRLVHLVIEEA